MCALLCLYFLFFFQFTVLYVARAFSMLMFTHAYIIVLYSDIGRKHSIYGYNFIFLAYTNVCSVTELT